MNILDQVNEFLTSKGKPIVGAQDALYSSGLLDSMEIVELVLTLGPTNIPVTGKEFMLEYIDTVEKIERLINENNSSD
jgi:hypothetical protein